ncbi:MAG TPA: hypothetical protein VG737_06570 [Cyclobacteriaceae bacterium]|nr:hypothetical protein [Cyclobacteriaceae bacterium]
MKKEETPLTGDELEAENALLRLKLEMEFGMLMDESSQLSPKMANIWLKSVYAFEQSYSARHDDD